MLTALGAVIALSGLSLAHFWITLILLGVGWNFGFLGATTMITECHTTEEAAKIRFHAPEATYLAWLDCRKIKLPASAFQFFLEQARIGFSAGETFDPGCAQFVRFNFATSLPILDQILERVVSATKQSCRTA